MAINANARNELRILLVDAIRRGNVDTVKKCIDKEVSLWLYDTDLPVKPSVKNAIKYIRPKPTNPNSENSEPTNQAELPEVEEYRLGSYAGRSGTTLNPYGICFPILEIFNGCPNPAEILDVLIPAMNVPAKKGEEDRGPASPSILSRVLMAVGLNGKEGLQQELEIQKIYFSALIRHGIDCSKVLIPITIAEHFPQAPGVFLFYTSIKDVDLLTYLATTVAKMNAYFEENGSPICRLFNPDSIQSRAASQESLQFGADMAQGLVQVLFGPVQKKALAEIVAALTGVIPNGVSALIASYYTPHKDTPLVFPQADVRGPKRGPR